MVTHRTSRRTGVTAMQLLVVLAVLLMLLAFLAPLVGRVRDAAARTQSINNLKQMALAMHNHHDVYKGFPPTVGEMANKTGSAHFFILPFIEQAPLYNNATNAVWDNEVWSKPIAIYLDPRDTDPPPGNVFEGWLATTNYPVNWMVCGDGNQLKRIVQITDGTSNTLMFAQRYQMCSGAPTAWGYPGLFTWAPMFAYYDQSRFQQSPAQADCDPHRPQAIGNVMIVAMCDGSVRAINPRVSVATWANLCDPADGQVLGNDF